MTIQIECDNCGEDLTYSRGAYSHSLVLKDSEYGPDSDFIYDVFIYPLLEEDKHFCGFGCLKKWMEND